MSKAQVDGDSARCRAPAYVYPHRRRVRRVHYLLLTFLATACATQADEPAGSGPAQAVGDETDLSMASAELELAAPPGAVCKLINPAQPDPTKALDVYADDEGTVSVYVSPTRLDELRSTLRLDCSASPTSLIKSAPARQLRRPLTSDEQRTASSDELLRAGYPPRPDASRHPQLYQQWLAIVSRPAQIVAPRAVSVPAISAGPQTLESNVGWAGNVLTDRGPYYLSDVSFKVPTVSAARDGRLAIWGGLGGSGGESFSALIQNGVFIVVSSSVVTYQAFYEYWRNAGQALPDFKVRPGDLLESTAWPTDNDENWNGVGIRGCFAFNNVTRGTTVDHVCMRTNSKNPPFLGATAEFIVEPQSRFLPNFGSVEVSGFAWATGGRYADTSTDPFSTLRLIDSTGATRVDVISLSAQTVLLAHISSFP